VRKSTMGIKSDILKWEKASQPPVCPILTEAPVYHVKRVHEDCPQRVFSPQVVFLYPLERTFFRHQLQIKLTMGCAQSHVRGLCGIRGRLMCTTRKKAQTKGARFYYHQQP
jgi:hypothetical protein